MQKMSGADLHFAVAELAHLQGKRIARVRKTKEGIFLIKIGGEELLFEPGVRLHLTRQALAAADSPDGFTALLRKNLEGKTAQKIRQVPHERIVEICTGSMERLVFELFRKGNLLFVSEGGSILACLRTEEALGRRIAKGERYEYPKATGFELALPEKPDFCVQEGVAGAPISFSVAGGGGRKFTSFSEAVDFYYANQPVERSQEKEWEGKLSSLTQRLQSQEKALAKISAQRKEAKDAADAIYREFDFVESLLAEVRNLKAQGLGDEEISRLLFSKGAKIKGTQLEVEI